MPKAYSYLRFSTPEQGEGDSRRRQTTMAEQYISRHPDLDLKLDTELTMADEGVSAFRGKNVETGALGVFLASIDAGMVPKGSYLLVESLDRISRQAARKAQRVLEDILDRGIIVVTLADGQEFSAEIVERDPFKLIFSLLLFIRGNEESTTKARRIRESWIGRREKASETGRIITAAAPAWLKLDREKGEFVRIPERVRIVKRIFRETLKGDGKNAIARRLNEERVPVFGDGQRWYPSYVQKILRSPSVIGTYVPHVEEHTDGKRSRRALDPIPDYYPAVVDVETFERVQSAETNDGKRRNVTSARNLFGSVLRCGRCGSAVTRLNKGEGSKGGTYLVCTAAKEGAGCKYEAVRYDAIEEAFVTHAPSILTDSPAGSRGEQIDAELANVSALLLVQTEKLENLSRAVAVRFSAKLANDIREAEDERNAMTARERDLIRQRAEVAGPLVSRKQNDLLAALSSNPMDRPQANVLLRQVFDSITLDYKSGGFGFVWKHGGETEAPAVWRFPGKQQRKQQRKTR